MEFKGKADILTKLKKAVMLKIKIVAVSIIIPIIIAVILITSLVKENKRQMSKSTQANIYKALNDNETDLSQLVEIKGDDSNGYYLEFVSDIDQRLQKVLKADKETYNAMGIKDVSILKKFIKAQLATEFPHLGARMSGGGSGASGSINGDPDLSNTTFYPRDSQNGWCQWYTTGRIREIYGLDIPPDGNPAVGSVSGLRFTYNILYDEWLCNTYPDYFEMSTEPAPGAVYCATAFDHVSFIRAVDVDAGTITVEDGNSAPFGYEGARFINWTSEYGITNRQGGSAGLAIYTESIESFKSRTKARYCVPTEKAKALMKGGNVTDKTSNKSNIDSLEGVLFIGDSITKGLENYHVITDKGVQFRGVISAAPRHWLNDQPVNGVPTFSSLPNDSDSITAICLMLGTNGIDNPAGQADTMKQVIEKIHDKYPNKTIYVQKILPVREYESQVETYNTKLEEICSSLGYTVCINSTANVELEPGDGVHPTANGSKTLAENTREQIIMGAQSGGKAVTNPNAFQGSIRIRRIGPNKGVGEYKELEQGQIIEEDIKNEGKTEEGRGKKEEIPENIKNKIIKKTVPEDKKEVLDSLAYLTIPYVDFKGAVKNGHMIVNKNIADEVLDLFQDLYNIRYPIEKMEIVEEYEQEEDTDSGIEYKSIDDNNTYSFYYLSDGAHSTGNAIAINPKINPKVTNGNPGHANAIKYSHRDDKTRWKDYEKEACIEKDSEAYKVFEKYGWIWGGDNSETPNYMHFEKTVISETETQKTVVDTRIYDLSYVPEETFNKYVEENNSRALRVYTLDDKKQLTIATWSYSTDGGLKISKGKTINYKAALSKYSMPVDYLLAILMHSEDKVFAEGLADLAIDSEYIISVQDSVNTTQTVTQVQTDTLQTEDITGATAIIGTSTESSTKVTESSSQQIEVTYVDCWFVKYAKDFSFHVDTSIGNIGNEVNLSGKKGEKIGDFTITAYCPCTQCSGGYGSATATGTQTKAGLTIAVDPNVIPLGSYVSFNDHIYHAEDVGGGVKGNHIDLYMDSHQDALNWGKKTIEVYWAEDVDGSEEESVSNTTSKNLNPITTTAKIMADVSGTQNTTSDTTTVALQGPLLNNSNGKKYSMYKRTITNVITKSLSIKYDTGKEHISGNAQKFIDLYNRKECKKARRNIYVPWLIETLEENQKTTSLCEITEYLFAQATGKHYKTSTLKFEQYKPGEFKDYSGASGLSTFKEYLHSWEGHTGISEDGTKYIVGDDGAGHPTVGYGIDIYNSGFLNRFQEAGYDVSIGAQIDVTFVDSLEDEEIRNALQTVETNCSGLNLTQYQKYALVSRIYNCGVAGALTIPRNGKSFVEAYNSYWDQSKDDEYKVTTNDGMFNHQLYTTFMNQPTTSAGMFMQGLENRRKSEWILFKTGYYDRIDKWCSNSSGGEFLDVARDVWAKVCEQQPTYSMAFGKTVPPSEPLQYVDCSHYVSWVLYEYGYKEFEGAQQSTYSLIGTNWTAKYGWEEITIGNGDVSSQLQPGDILVRDGHTCIVADTSGGKIMAYDCGSGTNQTGPTTWAGRWSEVKGSDSPVDSTYFATGNYGAGKIIRVTAP